MAHDPDLLRGSLEPLPPHVPDTPLTPEQGNNPPAPDQTAPPGESFPRKKGRGRIRRGRITPANGVPLTPAEEEQIAKMAAVGVGIRDIATRLRRSRDAVGAVLATPEVQEFMRQCREATRTITLAGVHETQTKAMDWLGEVVESRDPRAFDAVSRGVLNLEKTAASASGEARAQVQVAVLNQQQESDEVRDLIRALAQG